MHQLRIRLTVEQYSLIAYIADQEGEKIEAVIPSLIDEYIALVRRMDALDLLLDSDRR